MRAGGADVWNTHSLVISTHVVLTTQQTEIKHTKKKKRENWWKQQPGDKKPNANTSNKFTVTHSGAHKAKHN